MKRINILSYVQLGEALKTASQALDRDKSDGSGLYFGTYSLVEKLTEFASSNDGFSTAKRSAEVLSAELKKWISANVFDGDYKNYSKANFEKEFPRWNYIALKRQVESFRNVLDAEAVEVEIYSVDQHSIYKTSALVSSASDRFPESLLPLIQASIRSEFDSAGKCLAFNLPSACGFHSLRALELMIETYWQKCSGEGGTLKNWGEYVKKFSQLIEVNCSPSPSIVPSSKVVAMLDRIRDLDRNPLMHPRDTLDQISADQLFNLCAIAIVESAKHLLANEIPKTDLKLLE